MPVDTSSALTAIGATAGGVAGYLGGGAVVTAAFYAAGLTTVGPVAGGLFAANMGAGVVAGSWMALTQSLAMTSGAYVAGGAVGAVAGTGLGGYWGANTEFWRHLGANSTQLLSYCWRANTGLESYWGSFSSWVKVT